MLKRLWLILALLLVPAGAFAQATRITSGGTLPATCVVGNVYLKTGTSAGLYSCTATNTWTGPYITSAGSGADASLTYLTEADETSDLPNSLQLIAGSNVTFDTSTPNQLEISASGGGGSGGDRTIGITIDGGGSAISTGVKGFVAVPFSGTISAATLLSTDASATVGDIVIDVWKDTYANYPPTNADSITASAPPTLSSANKAEDTTLSGWTTSVSPGDVVGFNVDSASTVTRITLLLTVTP